jgi:hypothetical protein
MTRRRFLSTVCAGIAVAGLAACGRKNQPKYPEGSEFPHDYPYFPPEKREVKPKAPDAAGSEPADKSHYLKLDPIQNRSQ